MSSGDPVVYADLLANVAEDAPVAVTLSASATALVVLAAFGFRRRAALVLASILIGMAWLLGVLGAFSVKLNFLSFVALPITIGVGADYAVNLLRRDELEGDRRPERVFVETGGAVVL